MSIAEEARDFVDRFRPPDRRHHRQRVAEIVASVTKDEEMIAAGWLHDTLESTEDLAFEASEIVREFGPSVAALVLEVMERPWSPIEYDRFSKVSPRAKTIKIADLMDTALNMLKDAPETAGDYLIRMEALLEVLQGGDPGLLARAKSMVRVGRLKLNEERWVRLVPEEDATEGGEA